jgi:dolichol-phosphate mannosyltransferase
MLPGTLATVRDPMSGYFALRRSVIENIRLNPEGYKILLEVLGRGQYQTVEEIPYTFVEREQGNSKLGWWQYLEFVRHLARLSWETGELKRFLKFCIVGASGILVNLWMLVALTSTGMDYLKAGALAIEMSIATNFLLNEFWSFADFSKRRRSLSSRVKRFLKFNLFCTGGLVINVVALGSLTGYVGMHYLVSNAIGIGAAALWNYGLNANVTWESVRAERMESDAHEPPALAGRPLPTRRGGTPEAN